MLDTHLNMFDAAVIGIMLLSCIFAYFRGLVREILSLVAWIGAGVVTVYYFPAVAAKLEGSFKSHAVAAGIAATGLYIGALVAFGLINMLIIKSIKGSSDGGVLDNILGLAFGALRGALIVSLGFFLLTIALPQNEYPTWLKQSVTRPYVEKGAIMLARAAPDYLRELSSLQKKATDRLRATQQEDSAGNAAPIEDRQYHSHAAGEDVGYSRAASSQLDRLINSAEPSR